MIGQTVVPFISTAATLLGAVPNQLTHTILDKPVCKACEIVIGARRVSLVDTSSSAPELIGFLSGFGRLYLVAARGDAPQAFDANGHFIRSLGRKGSGPGEFVASDAFAAGPGDSIAVYDGGTRRIQLFDSNLRFGRSLSLPQGIVNGGVLWLADREMFAVSGPRASPEDISYTIHFYGRDGVHRRSIAESSIPMVPPSNGSELYRLLQPLPNGDVLSVSFEGAYTIEIWNIDTGKLRQRWVRDSPWFEVKAGPFKSRIVSAQVDSTGLLWTLISNPSPDWEKGVSSRVIGSGLHTETLYKITNRDLIADAVIEVIDVRRGELVARARFDKLYPALLQHGLLAGESPTGVGFDLFDIRLKRP